MENIDPQVAVESQPQQPVKSSNKTVLVGIVVALLVVFGAVIVYTLSTSTSNTYKSNASGSMQSHAVSPTPTSVTSTTDNQIDKDTQNIDTDIKSLDTDVSSVDQGLNDKPADLSQ